MSDNREKYYRLSIDFTNKAGELNRLLSTQKRIINKMASKKQSEETKALLLNVAESHMVVHDLVTWMHETLKQVALDSEALTQAAKMRNIIEQQSEEILMLWDKLK